MIKDAKYIVIMVVATLTMVTAMCNQAQSQVVAGCDANFYQMQFNMGQALEVRDQAVAHQVIRRNDNSHELVCLDVGMAVSARAGHIFSDVEVPIASIPFYDPLVAVGLMEYDYTTGQIQTPLLYSRISTGSTTIGSNWVSDFRDSIAYTMGYNSWNTTWFGLSRALALSNVMAFSYSCNHMQQVWYDGIMGEGITSGVNYGSFYQWFTQAVPGAGVRLNNALSSSTPVLNQARDDTNDLNVPGSYSSYKITPSFSSTATVSNVISNM